MFKSSHVLEIHALAARAGQPVSIIDAIELAQRTTPDAFAKILTPAGPSALDPEAPEASEGPVVYTERAVLNADPKKNLPAILALFQKITAAVGRPVNVTEALALAQRTTPTRLAEELGVELRTAA